MCAAAAEAAVVVVAAGAPSRMVNMDALALDVPTASPPPAPASAPPSGGGVAVPSEMNHMLDHAVRGAARAVHRLSGEWGTLGGMPARLDERRVPLSPNDLSEDRPVEWVWQGVALPPEQAMREHVALINNRMMGGVSELVVAALLMDRLTRARPRWVQPRGLRMVVIVTTIIAHKLVHETVITTEDCCGALADLWPDLCVARVGRMEYQLMDALGWNIPVGDVYQIYANAVFDCYNETAPAPMAAPQIIYLDD